MGGDTGQLQRLTDEQVNARLAAYNGDKSLDRDVQLLRDNVADIIASEIVSQFGKKRGERFSGNYASNVDAAWIENMAGYGREIYAERTSVPAYMVAPARRRAEVLARIVERYADDAEKMEQLLCAFHRVSQAETDIVLAQVSLLEANDAADRRGRESGDFERRVSDLVRASTEQSNR